jgi:hypothetical protein
MEGGEEERKERRERDEKGNGERSGEREKGRRR